MILIAVHAVGGHIECSPRVACESVLHPFVDAAPIPIVPLSASEGKRRRFYASVARDIAVRTVRGVIEKRKFPPTIAYLKSPPFGD